MNNVFKSIIMTFDEAIEKERNKYVPENDNPSPEDCYDIGQRDFMNINQKNDDE